MKTRKQNDDNKPQNIIVKQAPRHSPNEYGIAHIIKDIRIHFNRYEAHYYTTEVNQDTGKYYILEAKRKFTKYYLEHIAEFYGDFHDN
ncbi:hypothetical protein H8E77_22435 [bacterium]|nr:hypothetical protein [bacterium]